MRARFAVVVVCLVLSSGCLGKGEADDPFAYMGKPLYTGSFDLASFAGSTDGQQFRVEDGSIMTIRLNIELNATQGAATVTVTNPSGHVVLSDSTSVDRRVPIELGVWHVDIESSADADGTVHVFARRG